MGGGSDVTDDRLSDSGIMDTRFPGLSWMPRWTRKYLTPQTTFGIALGLFSAGSWVGTYLTAPDVRVFTSKMEVISKDLGEIKFVMGPACVKDCVLRDKDIEKMAGHVDDLWNMRVDIDAELARQEALKRAAAMAQAAAIISAAQQKHPPRERGKSLPQRSK